MRSVYLAVRRMLLVLVSVIGYFAYVRWSCALLGHREALVMREDGWIGLKCQRCQCKSPGWDLTHQKALTK